MRIHVSGSVFLALVLSAVPARAQVGTVSFATSATGETQEHFLRGLAFLHSFAFDDAIEHFEKAQALDRDFALAYWGEAMAYNGNPLSDPTAQDLGSARRALAKLAPSRAARLAKAKTPREKAYLDAVETLYGEGDKNERDLAYARAMERVVGQFPEDDEAQAFYALSLLGTVRRASNDFRAQMKAGAIVQALFRKNPDHPGAPHYIIHAFDDSVHAPLALYAAEKYAAIAPEAEHALHMPSHTFVQLGMWREVAASNRKAYDASVAWAQRKGVSDTKRDFHALGWLEYAQLQLGHYDEAKKSIEAIRPIAVRANTTDRIRATLANMEARYLLETERWQDLPLQVNLSRNDRYPGDAIELLAVGVRAAKTGDLATAERVEQRLAALKEQDAGGLKSSFQGQVTLEDLKRSVGVSHAQVAALVRLARGRSDEALRLARQAIEIDGAMYPSYGPPEPIKPTRELYGEILMALGQLEKAAAEFDSVLSRMPNRTQSLLSAARAATKLGNPAKAAELHQILRGIWDETSQAAGRREAATP